MAHCIRRTSRGCGIRPPEVGLGASVCALGDGLSAQFPRIRALPGLLRLMKGCDVRWKVGSRQSGRALSGGIGPPRPCGRADRPQQQSRRALALFVRSEGEKGAGRDARLSSQRASPAGRSGWCLPWALGRWSPPRRRCRRPQRATVDAARLRDGRSDASSPSPSVGYRPRNSAIARATGSERWTCSR
jgi:hypothetical protein